MCSDNLLYTLVRITQSSCGPVFIAGEVLGRYDTIAEGAMAAYTINDDCNNSDMLANLCIVRTCENEENVYYTYSDKERGFVSDPNIIIKNFPCEYLEDDCIHILFVCKYKEYANRSRIVKISKNINSLKMMGEHVYSWYDQHDLLIGSYRIDQPTDFGNLRTTTNWKLDPIDYRPPHFLKYNPTTRKWVEWDKYLDECLQFGEYEGYGEFSSKEEQCHNGILGFCGCGCPEDSLSFVAKCLSHFDKDGHVPLPNTWGDVPEDAATFFLYVMDALGITDHGGSIYGSWLTDKGDALRQALIETGYIVNK